MRQEEARFGMMVYCISKGMNGRIVNTYLDDYDCLVLFGSGEESVVSFNDLREIQTNSNSKIMETKVCKCCGKELPIENFGLKSSSKDGHQSYCKECQKEKMREYQREKRRKEKETKENEFNEAEQERKNKEMVARLLKMSEEREEEKEVDDAIPTAVSALKEAPKDSAIKVEATPPTSISKSRRKTIASAEPVELITELANRGYYGHLHLRETKRETINHNGHDGIFEYELVHDIDVSSFKGE